LLIEIGLTVASHNKHLPFWLSTCLCIMIVKPTRRLSCHFSGGGRGHLINASAPRHQEP